MKDILPSPLFFERESSSNTGSIIRHGAQVVEVKNATTARCERRRDSNDARFVEIWTGAATVFVEGVLVPEDAEVEAPDAARSATA